MKTPSVNEIIFKLSTEIIDNPRELSQYLVYITANLWKYGEDVVQSEIDYAKKWSDIRSKCDTDGMANVLIKIEPEYKKWQISKVNEKTLIEIIRSLKKRLLSINNEINSY